MSDSPVRFITHNRFQRVIVGGKTAKEKSRERFVMKCQGCKAYKLTDDDHGEYLKKHGWTEQLVYIAAFGDLGYRFLFCPECSKNPDHGVKHVDTHVID